MKEKNLLKLALICSITGIFLLYVLSENLDYDEKNINKINSEDIGNKIKIKGFVENFVDAEDVLIIDVIQANNIDVIVFKDNNKSIDIQKDDFIEVIGEVKEYKGNLEVIAHRIRMIR